MPTFFKIITALIAIIIMLTVSILLYLQQAQFDKPSVDTTRISYQNERHYQEGVFGNDTATNVISKKQNRLLAWYTFFFKEDPNAIPTKPLPSKKTDLKLLNKNDNVIVWMGHSSYYIQMDGISILIDPVFSDYAPPIPGTNTAFSGSNIYTVDDIPPLDYLLISHDHWDHLDYPTIEGLKGKVSQVVTPLGVGSYFTQWGYDPQKVFEGDWGSSFKGEGIDINILPAYHFSGRMLTRNQTLWGSFALITPNQKIYVSGDTGYGTHFKDIGEQFGPFDVAILECGQYDPNWATIHMSPEQAAQAAEDIKAINVLAAHNSKFKLAHHPWNDPYIRLTKASERKPYHLLTPMIGEQVNTSQSNQTFSTWWKAP